MLTKTSNNLTTDSLRKHITGLTIAPFASVAGFVYSASVVGPVYHGLKDKLADHSAERHIALREAEESRGCGEYAAEGFFPTMLAVLREFGAPLTWAVKGYRAGYNFVL